jgi:beta-mannanase
MDEVLVSGERSWVMQLGWEPLVSDRATPRIPLDDINAGQWDEFLHRWFTALAADGRPLFLRFASEMNGSWSPYGGAQNGANLEAAGKFVAMWRRVYNIAERVFAERDQPSNVAFLWAGNYKSFPDESWNALANYYPGDPYVDWVGLDVYSSCAACSEPAATANDPGYWLGPVYGAWADRKPIVIAEAGGQDDAATQSSQSLFVDQLFDALESHPRVKAFYWFNRDEGGRWVLAGPGLAEYARRVAAPRYVSTVADR